MCVGRAAHVCGYSVLKTVWVASLPPTQIRKRMSTPMVMDLTNMHCALIDGKYDIQRKCHVHKYSSAIVLCSTKKKKEDNFTLCINLTGFVTTWMFCTN